MASPLRGRLMVGRLTLDQVVKVRVLAPQPRKPRLGGVLSFGGWAQIPVLQTDCKRPRLRWALSLANRVVRAARTGMRGCDALRPSGGAHVAEPQTAREQGSTRMPLHLQQRPIWLIFQDGVLPDRQRDCLDAAFVAALTQELAIVAVQLTDLEDSIVHFSHQQRMLRPARPVPRPLHAPLRGRRTVLLRQ
jgi:hypothetical protein